MSLTPLYTPQEVADLWKVTRRTVYQWIKTGKLKACKIGDTVRIAEADLKAFVTPIPPEVAPKPKAAKATRGKAKRRTRNSD